MIIRYSPYRAKAWNVIPIITTKTFATSEEAVTYGVESMGIALEDIDIEEVKYEDDSWKTSTELKDED